MTKINCAHHLNSRHRRDLNVISTLHTIINKHHEFGIRSTIEFTHTRLGILQAILHQLADIHYCTTSFLIKKQVKHGVLHKGRVHATGSQGGRNKRHHVILAEMDVHVRRGGQLNALNISQIHSLSCFCLCSILREETFPQVGSNAMALKIPIFITWRVPLHISSFNKVQQIFIMSWWQMKCI